MKDFVVTSFGRKLAWGGWGVTHQPWKERKSYWLHRERITSQKPRLYTGCHSRRFKVYKYMWYVYTFASTKYVSMLTRQVQYILCVLAEENTWENTNMFESFCIHNAPASLLEKAISKRYKNNEICLRLLSTTANCKRFPSWKQTTALSSQRNGRRATLSVLPFQARVFVRRILRTQPQHYAKLSKMKQTRCKTPTSFWQKKYFEEMGLCTSSSARTSLQIMKKRLCRSPFFIPCPPPECVMLFFLLSPKLVRGDDILVVRPWNKNTWQKCTNRRKTVCKVHCSQIHSFLTCIGLHLDRRA